MARPTIIQQGFSRGVISDLARNQLPPDALWQGVDWLPNQEGMPLRKRGGWKIAQDASALGASSIIAMAFGHTAHNKAHLFISGNNGKTLVVDDDGTTRQVTQANAKGTKPWNHNEHIIYPAGLGFNPAFFKGPNGDVTGTIASAPTAYCGDVYRGRSLLGYGTISGTTYHNRVWFSNVEDPETWDTTNVWVDMLYGVGGICALRGMILVFSDHHVERLVGTTPPGVQGSDMYSDVIHDVGCFHQNSVARYGDNAVWANWDGVYMSDGASLLDLTAIGGFKQRWRDTVGDGTVTRVVAGGIMRNQYVISVCDNSNVCLGVFMVDLTNRTWTVHSNIQASMFVSAGKTRASGAYGGQEELYFGMLTTPKAGSVSPIWTPTGATKADGNGVNVLPSLETRYLEGDPGKKRMRELYLGYTLLDAASDNPVLRSYYTTDPLAGSWTQLGDFAEQAAYDRQRLPVHDSGRGFAFKIQQVGPSADTAIYDLGGEVRALEPSK